MTRYVATFFYGLFMDPDILREQGASPRNPRRGHVDGLALRIGARAWLLPQDGARAWGLVMDLSHSDLDRLYSSASVSPYRPEPVTVHLLDGGTCPALCYNLPAPDESVPTDFSYVRRLAAIMQKLELPEEAGKRLPCGP